MKSRPVTELYLDFGSSYRLGFSLCMHNMTCDQVTNGKVLEVTLKIYFFSLVPNRKTVAIFQTAQ
jgi:hypothetical protein